MAIMEGPLSKWTNVMKGWQYRWFVLDETAGLLSYYTSKEKMMRGSRRGCVRLKGAVIGIDDEDDSTFTINVDHKTFHFQARDIDEKDKWANGLEMTIRRHAVSSSAQTHERQTAYRKNFHEKLAEADAYLQIMMKQVKSLDAKIPLCKKEQDQRRHSSIKEAADTMIDSIKEAIVLLQISKASAEGSTDWPKARQEANVLINDAHDTAHDTAQSDSLPDVPLDGATDVLELCAPDSSVASTEDDASSLDADDASTQLDASSMPDLSAATDATEATPVPQEQHSVSPEVKHLSPKRKTVPDLSYSSSDEEDYFDAVYEDSSDSVPAAVAHNSKTLPEERKRVSLHVIRSKDDYYDELYDDVSEDELDSLNMHGSVITHLLSQVRIGMDLTKIVLPTFILERRSLLEMFADFLAHPDLFVGIMDLATPRERIVQVVRWYLSAFHAGRPSEIAKKPYNPIIGETFQCSYDLPGEPTDGELSTDGPLPWVRKNSVAFIAEQVSHHPPISAFYAEHPNKRISVDGYIWTKSRFLGIGIGVYMLGPAVLTAIDFGEDYVLTFPTAYGRSILTVPWIELGGKVHISCAKTGFYANVIFHTKPFWGGKKHQVTADICAPNEKKPFCTVTGEWNGTMWAKYESGHSEVFLDTKKMPVMKKLVKPIEEQTEFESRRLWKDVTRCLKAKDVEGATEYKSALEARQRDEAKKRHEKGATWQTKRFHEVGEHWVYDKPLVKRIITA